MITGVDISVRPRGGDKAYLVVGCRYTSMGECLFPLWQRPAAGTMWQWDGNVEQPTVTPSIDCHGGCGRHFTLTAGVPR
jgi:hypothetical protein